MSINNNKQNILSLKLTITSGPCNGEAVLYNENDVIQIGRHSKCTLSLPEDTKASRFHCKINKKNGRFILEDLQSSNGTFHNQEMLTSPVEIKNNDVLQVGTTVFHAKIFNQNNQGEISDSEEELLTKNIEKDRSEFSIDPYLGGGETVIGLSLSSLLSDSEKASINQDLFGDDQSLKIPEQDMLDAPELEVSDKKAIKKNIISKKDWTILHKNIPNVIKRRKSSTDEEIDGYILRKKMGESYSCNLWLCNNSFDLFDENNEKDRKNFHAI